MSLLRVSATSPASPATTTPSIRTKRSSKNNKILLVGIGTLLLFTALGTVLVGNATTTASGGGRRSAGDAGSLRVQVNDVNTASELLGEEDAAQLRREVSDVCGVTCFFNPAGFASKADNFNRFSARVRRQGLFLILVELAYDDQPFALGGGLEAADKVSKSPAGMCM